MLVFFVILAFLAEGFCEDAVIEKTSRPRLCGENEVYVKCRTICQPRFCNVSYTTNVCEGVKKCEPGCDCIKNHLRDDYGRCILNENCPPPPIRCGENQVPSDCADNYSEIPQITLCRRGCRCIENYTRNSYDECVPTPPPLVCGENEEASTCKQTCPPQNCDWDPTKYACKPGPCQPGCNCKKHYLRDSNRKCIPKEMCSPILPECGDNEEPTDCAKNIRPFDSTLTIKCRPCQCIEGYVRDINGVCVLKEEFCKNEPNTTYTLCPNRCKSTCKNPNGICSAVCREDYGCGCKPGYLLSEQGKCILPEDCPGGNPCGRNQTFVYCNAGCPTAKCPTTNSRGIIACSQPNPCPSGCVCKRNYKRQKDGLCTLASECPPVKCAENERWNPCPPPCFSENCGDKQTKIVCMTLIAHECQPQCVCKENHRRNIAGMCIPISQCPPQCGENEEPTDCSDTYPQPLATDVASESKVRCQPGCKCIAGYIKDSTGACVRKQPQCGKNEEPNFCIAIFPSNCPPCRCIANHIRNSLGLCVPAPQCGKNEELTDCSDTYPQPLATDVASESRVRCQPECKCIAGYIKDITGACVRKELQCGKNEEPNVCIAIFLSNCPPCRCIANHIRNSLGLCVPAPQCGKNEEPTDCSDTYPQPLATDVASESRVRCQPGCKCIAGYIKDSSGTCVRKELQCGKNEEPNVCIAIFPSNCPPCRCIANHIRNSLGLCVPAPQCGKNEELTDCSDTYPQPLATDVASESRVRCQPECKCIAGYIKDITGACVRKELQCGKNEEPNVCIAIFPSNCPPCRCIANHIRNSLGLCVPAPQCGKNEEPTDCSDTYPQPLATDVASESRVRCQPGCKCIAGYIKDSSGTCVRKELQCGKNEEPNVCIAIFPSNCPPCRCIANHIRNSLGLCVPAPQCGKNEELTDCSDTYPQPLATDVASESRVRCQPECKCIAGYIKDITGACVRTPQCGKNEEPTDCSDTYPQPLATDVASESRVRCQPGCKCIAGYIKDSSGACVRKTVIKCGENEELSDCKQECPPQNCSWDPRLMDCRPVSCKPGCNCIKGYLRDANGACIPRENCPECNGDKYAIYTKCPNQCVSTCKNPNAVCSQECGEPFGCKCKYGYILSEEGRCILPNECPGSNPCGRNETFFGCVFGCPTNNCPRDASGAIAQCLSPNPCLSGCACQSKYKRVSFENKKCILASDCPPIKCEKNEHYNPCPSACFSEGCGSPQLEPKTCNTLVPNVCQPRCVCKTDFRRDSSGYCIPKEKCPPQTCTRENEVMNSCPVACLSDGCGKLDEDTAACNTFVEHVCKPRCMCRKGYCRDSNGNCIPKEKFPAVSSSRDEGIIEAFGA